MILLYLLLFYWGFAMSISVYRQWLLNRLNRLNEVIFFVPLAIFFLTDCILNLAVLTPIMGISPNRTITISDRFAYYHKNDSGWRNKVATFVCEKLLNPVDPAGNHC